MLTIVTEEKVHNIKYQGAIFGVVPNTKEEHKALVEKNTFFKKIKKGPTKKPEYVEAIDFVGLLADRIDSQVKTWKGIAGKLECNSENKRALALKKENDHICSHIISEIEKIGQHIEKKKKEEAKN